VSFNVQHHHFVITPLPYVSAPSTEPEAVVSEGGDEEEGDPDFPEVKLDELLDDFEELAIADEDI
jgi:60S ribosomal export protein NMD3